MMINDPNYNLPKDAFIRLFDNPIPAGDPARSDAPEWAQELDEVVVWAHMGDNGTVTVFVNGEEAGGGGGGFQTATLTLSGDALPTVPVIVQEGGADAILSAPWSPDLTEVTVPVPCILMAGTGNTVASISGDYEQVSAFTTYLIKGDCTVEVEGGGG